MPSNTTAQDESGDRIPPRVATAGRQTFGQRLTATGARLFGSATGPHNGETTPSWTVRQHVLRDSHAANLAAARAVSEDLVRAGFNAGDVPYGYRARRVRVTPPGRRPCWRTRLLIEPVEASTVRMIFAWKGGDRPATTEIRRRLAASRYPAPLDPETDKPGVWTVAIVRAILRNPKYLGRQVWRRTHHAKPTPRTDWVWSEVWVHPPVVTTDEFAAADRRSWGTVPAGRDRRRLGECFRGQPTAGRVMATNHHPDGLTIEAITARQREINGELRREGYPRQPAQPAFVAIRPAQTHRLQADHASPQTDGAPARPPANGDGAARSLRGSTDDDDARPKAWPSGSASG